MCFIHKAEHVITLVRLETILFFLISVILTSLLDRTCDSKYFLVATAYTFKIRLAIGCRRLTRNRMLISVLFRSQDLLENVINNRGIMF